ncbi:aspartyl-phosphate phosphatase Spo0E family protein [Pontibacillus salicampi]|uniref:Aspartyl-phosphate phosphatase Spo0E family protein n=1 Tax=Pontibacillus salicampi TaxID=1449801 RepID=A0ABV6LN16_9BACI
MSKELLNEIESTREKMVHLATCMPLSSKEVVQVSAQLDFLLNQYESSSNK